MDWEKKLKDQKPGGMTIRKMICFVVKQNI